MAFGTWERSRRMGCAASVPIRLQTLLALLAFCFCVPSAQAQGIPKAQIYGGRIVLSDPALQSSKAFAPALVDLRQYLKRITGTDFIVATANTNTGPAIRLQLSASKAVAGNVAQALRGRGLEPFHIDGSRSALTITANDTQGLSHGIYYYLEMLGVRWLMPGDNWTVIPTRSDIRIKKKALIAPDFKVRSYAGTGGYYSYWWGRRYSQSAVREAKTAAWQRRLRYGGEYHLGKHMGEAFIADRRITAVLKKHPEYLASRGGKRLPLYDLDRNGKMSLNIIAQLDAGNPAAVALYCDWIVETFSRLRKGPDPRRRSVASVDPADGDLFGDNVAQLPGNGSPSDQAFHIANVCARTIRKTDPDAWVILLAYTVRSSPPSFALEPNVIVQLTPYAFQTTPPPAVHCAVARQGVPVRHLRLLVDPRLGA